MTGSWEPVGTWRRIHESTTGGKFHLETMATSDGKYKVRLVGSEIVLAYDSEPEFEAVVDDLKAKV
ncbi:hypothetical protein BDV96DRAFT_571492 [Lophiotrema nucula]|uniref:Uncharacterized protein n=1 Tax=Lophiotrema nucula TaxID=690887 RepID=A0A6A5ZFD9_9PLEO|nr:hypothetical protein BDV96DRAFT_571492 [Lophiotrema nucula]